MWSVVAQQSRSLETWPNFHTGTSTLDSVDLLAERKRKADNR